MPCLPPANVDYQDALLGPWKPRAFPCLLQFRHQENGKVGTLVDNHIPPCSGCNTQTGQPKGMEQVEKAKCESLQVPMSVRFCEYLIVPIMTPKRVCNAQNG